MLDDRHKKSFWSYMRKHCPLVAIISTPCTGLKGWSDINKIMNHATWLKSRATSIPLGELGADVAKHQLKHKRDYLSENPLGSDLYRLYGWLEVGEDPRTTKMRVDMCAAGLRDEGTDLPVLKASEIWHSNDRFTESLSDLRCSKDHEHAVLEGSYKGESKTSRARTWTWTFASRVASGVAAIVRDYHQKHQVKAYPSNAASSTAGVPTVTEAELDAWGRENPQQRRRSAPQDWGCPWCQGNYDNDDTRHWLNDECKWGPLHNPGRVPVKWECKACQGNHNRLHLGPKHSFIKGECRFYDYKGRQAKERKGHHPRDVRTRGHQDPTQEVRMGTEETRERTGLDPLFDDENLDDGVATPPYDGPTEGPPSPHGRELEEEETPLIEELEAPDIELEPKQEVKEEPDDEEGTEQREERPPRPRPRRARERDNTIAKKAT